MAGGERKDRLRSNHRLIIGLILLGAFNLLFYLSWWVYDVRYASVPLLFILFLAILYSGVQLLGNWILYLAIQPKVDPPEPPGDLTMDVFITACGEPFEMIENTLQAACQIVYPHRTWLLDDQSDPALKALAESLGAGYLTREDRSGAKAGNLNAAFSQTQGDVLAIFDVDHIPEPDFLERTVGFFLNPKVGFVQVMLTFHNHRQSWVAQAATETSLEFYNPTSLGADGIGGATLMGSNALIRRQALESIGGYQTGLAEDLATSIALHAAGWQSVYVAEPLAPGIAPPDLGAWFTQQLKWARGVFELLLTAYPRLFMRLTWGQRLSYAVRMTKYWIGPAVFIHLFGTIAILIFADLETRASFHDYLVHLAPLVMADIFIRYSALKLWGHPSVPRASLIHAVTLVYATWPIYLFAWIMALFRLPLNFRPTPKTITGGLKPVWLLPQMLMIVFLTIGTLYTVLVIGHSPSLLLTVAIVQGLLQLILLMNWLFLEIKLRRRPSIRASSMPRIHL